MVSKRQLKIILPAIAVAAFGVAIITTFLSQLKDTLPPLPNPNGYDDFIKAGKALVGDGSDYETKTRDELVRFVAANSNTFQFIAVGLSKESRVPLEYSASYMSSHFYDMAQLDELATALRVEGYLAEKENRTNDAARAYLDCALFGAKCEPGGLVLDYETGFLRESACQKALSNIIPVLDTTICRQYINSLEQIDRSMESPEEILSRDKAWNSRVLGIRWRIFVTFNSRSSKQESDSFKKSYFKSKLRRRQLILDLATQAYKQENGHLPNSAKQLVPQYLKSVPVDPETGAPLKIDSTPTTK